MHRGIRGAGEHPEIEFAKAICSLYQLGEVDVFYECKIHSTLVWKNQYAIIVQLLLKKIIRFIQKKNRYDH
jgi:hypothetical protein